MAHSALKQAQTRLQGLGVLTPRATGEGGSGRSWREDVSALPCHCCLLGGRSRQCCEHLPSAACHSSIPLDWHFSCLALTSPSLFFPPPSQQNNELAILPCCFWPPAPLKTPSRAQSKTVTHCSLAHTSNKNRAQNFVGFKENESRVQPSQRPGLVLGCCSSAVGLPSSQPGKQLCC